MRVAAPLRHPADEVGGAVHEPERYPQICRTLGPRTRLLGHLRAIMATMKISPTVTLLERPLYDLGEAARLLELSTRKVRRWLDGYERAGVRYPPVIRQEHTGDDVVTWGEFVELGYLREYRDAGVPLQTLRPFVSRLREEFGIPHPLAHEGVYLAERRQLVLQVQQATGVSPALYMVVDSAKKDGQLVLSQPVGAFLRRVEFDQGTARRWLPSGHGSPVVVDPSLSFGVPTVRGIRTEILADAFTEGESVETLAEDFGLSTVEVEAALRSEQRWRRAA